MYRGHNNSYSLTWDTKHTYCTPMLSTKWYDKKYKNDTNPSIRKKGNISVLPTKASVTKIFQSNLVLPGRRHKVLPCLLNKHWHYYCTLECINWDTKATGTDRLCKLMKVVNLILLTVDISWTTALRKNTGKKNSFCVEKFASLWLN